MKKQISNILELARDVFIAVSIWLILFIGVFLC
jgi:hypothetical protein